MKNVILSIVLLFALTNCSDQEISNSDAELLIGTWKIADAETTIAFDDANNYIITYGRGENGIHYLKYQLDRHLNRFYIEGLACEFEFLGNDHLKLTLMNPTLSNPALSVATYHRIK